MEQFNPVDYNEATWTFQVRLPDGELCEYYADDDTYDILWLYCINNGLLVTSCLSNGKH